MGTSAPLRIDLFDDEIEAIRRFDPETPTLTRLARERTLAAGTRSSRSTPMAIKEFRRRFRDALRRRPDRTTHLSRRQRRHRAGGHRVLPAAVLRWHSDPVRLSARQCGHRRTMPRCPARSARPGTMSKRATRIAVTISSAQYCDRRELFLSPRRHRRAPRGHSPRSRWNSSRPTRSCRGAAKCTQLSRRRRRASCASMSGRKQPFAPLRPLPGRIRRARTDRGRLSRTARSASGDVARTRPHSGALSKVGMPSRRRGDTRPDGSSRPRRA